MASSFDPTDLHNRERAAESEELVAHEKRRKELEDLRWMLAHPQGRRILTRLLEEAGVYRSSFNHSGSLMAFAEGKRHIGLFLTAEMMEASTKGFMKVLEDYKAKE